MMYPPQAFSIETLIVDGGVGSINGFNSGDPFGLTFNDDG